MVESAWTLLLIALFAERVVEIAKPLLQPWAGGWSEEKRTSLWRGLALAVGVILAFGLRVDLFALAGVEGANPLLGMVLAGLFAGMGTEWVHHLLTNLPRLAVEGRKLRLLPLRKP